MTSTVSSTKKMPPVFPAGTFPDLLPAHADTSGKFAAKTVIASGLLIGCREAAEACSLHPKTESAAATEKIDECQRFS